MSLKITVAAGALTLIALHKDGRLVVLLVAARAARFLELCDLVHSSVDVMGHAGVAGYALWSRTMAKASTWHAEQSLPIKR